MPTKQKAKVIQAIRQTIYLRADKFQALKEMAEADHGRSISAVISILIENEQNRQRLAQQAQEAQNVG